MNEKLQDTATYFFTHEGAIKQIGALETKIIDLELEILSHKGSYAAERNRATILQRRVQELESNFFVRITNSVYRGLSDAKCSLTRFKWYARITTPHRCQDCRKIKWSVTDRSIVNYMPGFIFKQCSRCARLAEKELGFRYLISR